MAFPTSYVQGGNIEDIFNNDTAIALDTDTIKVALYTNSLTGFDSTAAEGYSASPWNTTYEVTSANYTAGGSALTTPGTAISAGKIIFDDEGAATLAWSNVTFTTRGCGVYDDSIATPVSKPLLCAINFGSDLSPSADSFTITWDATNGIFYATFGTGS